jgi:hypothetical protein
MRKLFFLMLLAGFGLGFGYPWYIYNMSGKEIGSYTVYRQTTGFTPVDVVLSQSQSPVRVFADLTPLKGYYPDQARTMLTFTASVGGRTVLATTMNYVASSEEAKNLQTADKVFRDRAGDLVIDMPGTYRIVVGEGDLEGLSLKKVELVLRANAVETDQRAFPAGLALFALGVFGMIRSGRRRNVGQDPDPSATPPPAEPEKPKWGRDAADK